MLTEEKSKPKRINFDFQSKGSNANEGKLTSVVFDAASIRDIVCSQTFSLALSEDGEVYSWGRGSQGHLGSGSDVSRVYPEKVKFKQFKDEQKKINKAKSEVSVADAQLDQVEDLLFRKKFLKHASVNSGKHQAIID